MFDDGGSHLLEESCAQEFNSNSSALSWKNEHHRESILTKHDSGQGIRSSQSLLQRTSLESQSSVRSPLAKLACVTEDESDLAILNCVPESNAIVPVHQLDQG